MTKDDYIKLAEDFVVSDNVPTKIRSLFEKAQKLYCFGFLEYENFTTALEQAIFAFEAAITTKYKDIKGPTKILIPPESNKKRNPNLEFMINYLLEKQLLDREFELAYHLLRKERNNIAHSNDDRHIKIADLTIAYNLIKFYFRYC